MKTKDKILLVALDLFNATNTQANTTNHIAKAMGISIGNLHYHYSNREEIIRSLYKQFRTKLTGDGVITCIAQFEANHKNVITLLWEYRFLQRELLFLLSRDEILKQQYISDNIEHKKRIIQSLNNMVETDILNLKDNIARENIIEYLCDTILMSIQFFNPFLQTIGEEVSEQNIERSVIHIRSAMRPFLTTKALTLLKEFDN